MVEKIYSKAGRMFLVERFENSVYVAADAFSDFGSQLFVHECMKKTGLKYNKTQKNVIAEGLDYFLFGVGYYLPLLGKEHAMQKVRNAIANYES